VRVLDAGREIGPIIRHHHERWDGRGYVDALQGEEIPFLARIVSVADAYDAMSSDRPYRRALPPEEVTWRLTQGAGTQWDPRVVRALLDSLDTLVGRP
jgi:HD-GYP domain-containing protein (c-di-GMP phosphodiesterase class II)